MQRKGNAIRSESQVKNQISVGKHDTAQSDCALLRVYCAEFLKNWLHWTDILGIINSNSN